MARCKGISDMGVKKTILKTKFEGKTKKQQITETVDEVVMLYATLADDLKPIGAARAVIADILSGKITSQAMLAKLSTRHVVDLLIKLENTKDSEHKMTVLTKALLCENIEAIDRCVDNFTAIKRLFESVIEESVRTSLPTPDGRRDVKGMMDVIRNVARKATGCDDDEDMGDITQKLRNI